MNPDIYNTFFHHDLTPQEVVTGSLLSALQVKCIQTQMATYAEELIALEPDVSNPTEFFVRRAKLQGRIEALRAVLENSDTAYNG
jgi:hypothetical protein